MAVPAWAQHYLNQNQAQQDQVQQVQDQAQRDQAWTQAEQGYKSHKIVDGVDPALSKVSDFNKFASQANPEFAAKHPTITKALAAPGYALQKAADLFPQGLQNWANRAGQSGGEVMTMVDNPNRATTGNWLGDTSADLAGGLMGFVGNPTPGGVESLGAKIWQGGEQAIGKVLPRLLPKAPKLAQDALKITGATIPFEATRAIANNRKMDPTEMGTAVGANVLLGAATHGLGRLGKSATRVEPAGNGAIQPQYRDVAPISTADQGLNDVGGVVKPISVNRVNTALPGYQVDISDNVPLGKGAVPNRSVAANIENPSAQMTVGLGKGTNPTSSLIPQRPVRVPGAAPNIPLGKEERGFSENTRTDVNNPDALRDSYTQNPLTYEQLGNPVTLAKAQAIMDQGYESARIQLSDLASRMQPEAIPLAKLLSRQAAEAGNIQGSREIISEVAERLTQAGQFGQAARILREADPETFLMTIGKQLKKLNKEGLETYGKKWKNIDLTPEELDMVSKIERGNQQAYESAFEQIQTRIANELPSTAMEKINAWRHISMLLNPKTQIRNIGGNAIMTGMRRTAKQVSAVLQNVLLKPEDRTQVFKIKEEYQQAAAAHFEANKKDLLAGGNKYNEGIKLGMTDKRVFQNNALEGTRKLTYKLLEMGDTPFYKNAYINRLASYAQAKGIKDFSKLPQEALDTARIEAEQATYKDASVVASFLNKVKHPSSNASLGQKTTAFAAEAALPFTKTPINIIKRGIQYSPAGVLNGISKWKSAEGAAAGIDEMAKGLTGTAILGLGYLLASKGVLTGKAAKDADLKAYDANTGNSPFSILGKFTYDWAQPFSVPLSIGVEVYNALKDNPMEAKKMDSLVADNNTSKLMQIAVTVSSGIYDSLAASGDTVFNMSIMKGIKNLLGNPQGFTAGLAQLPQNYATQFVPTVFNQVAGMVDPIVRQTYVNGNLPESIKTSIQSKIPFASKSLQPKQTPFGEDVKRPDNLINRAFSQFLSPGIIAVDQKIDPKIDTELRRLNKEGLTNQFPTMVPNYIEKTQKNPRIELTPEEATQYQKRVGQLTLSSFGKIVDKGTRDNKAKNKSADEVKADLFAGAIADAKAQAKKEIVENKGFK